MKIASEDVEGVHFGSLEEMESLPACHAGDHGFESRMTRNNQGLQLRRLEHGIEDPGSVVRFHEGPQKMVAQVFAGGTAMKPERADSGIQMKVNEVQDAKNTQGLRGLLQQFALREQL